MGATPSVRMTVRMPETGRQFYGIGYTARMSKKNEFPQPIDSVIDPLAKGSVEFFASQANVMLETYNNFDRLLGGTKGNWTPSGTLGESLIRDFLRRHLPKTFSVDKGFVFGRHGGNHSPEIDILIHDDHQYAPMFKADEFVIVRPEAVRGIIQVKRTLAGKEFEKGVRNIITAKQFILDVLLDSDPDILVLNACQPTFSGVISFDASFPTQKTIAKLLATCREECDKLNRRDGFDSSLHVMPHYVGSLSATFGMRYYHQSQMFFYNSFQPLEDKRCNIAISFLLMHAYREAKRNVATMTSDNPPLWYPDGTKPVFEVQL